MARSRLPVLLALGALLLAPPRRAAANFRQLPIMFRPTLGDPLPAAEIDIKATSSQAGHGPQLLLDDRLETAWCEDRPGNGEGATLTLRFRTPQSLAALRIIPFWAADFAHARHYGALLELDLLTDAGPFHARLSDRVDDLDRAACDGKLHSFPKHNFEPDDCLPADELIHHESGAVLGFGHYIADNPRNAFIPEPVMTSRLVVVVRRVRPGSKLHVTCASTLQVYPTPTH